ENLTKMRRKAASEPVSRLQFATIDGGTGLVAARSGRAGRPAQVEVRTERKHDMRSIQVGLDADSLLRGREHEVQGAPEYYGIGFPHARIDRLAKYFRLEQDGGSIRPIERAGSDHPAAPVKTTGIDAGKGAGAGDTGGARVAELVARTRIQGRRCDCR